MKITAIEYLTSPEFSHSTHRYSGVLRRYAHSCLRPEVLESAPQQPYKLSSLDRKLLLAISICSDETKTGVHGTHCLSITTRTGLTQSTNACKGGPRRTNAMTIHPYSRLYSTTHSTERRKKAERDIPLGGPEVSVKPKDQILDFFFQGLKDIHDQESIKLSSRKGNIGDPDIGTGVDNTGNPSVPADIESIPLPEFNISSVDRGSSKEKTALTTEDLLRSSPLPDGPKPNGHTREQRHLVRYVNDPLVGSKSASTSGSLRGDVSKQHRENLLGPHGTRAPSMMRSVLQNRGPTDDLYSHEGRGKRKVANLTRKLWQIFQEGRLETIIKDPMVEIGVSSEKADDLFSNGKDVHSIRQAWLQLSTRTRTREWRDLALYYSVTSSPRALAFLEATHKDLPYVPWIFIWCLNAMRWWRWDAVNETPEMRKSFDHLYSSLEEGRQFFDLSSFRKHDMSATMATRFMNFFRKNRDIDYALKAFHTAAKQRESLETELMLRSCNSLLQLDYVERNGDTKNFRILPELLGAGLDPNLIIHNLTITKSFENKLSSVGWDVFDYMVAKKLPTDSYTYVALLRNCVDTDDLTRLSEVLATINSRDDLANNVYVIGNTLHAIRMIYANQQQVETSRLFDQQLAFYNKKLKVAPLQHLLQLPITDHSADQDKLDPSHVILQIMTSSYILSVATPTYVLNFWHRFRELITRRDKIAFSVTQTPHIYGALILFFSRSPATLRELLQVLQFMLERNERGCKVTEHLYLTAAIGMLRHDKRAHAMKILELMRINGYDPRNIDDFWNGKEHWGDARLKVDMTQMLEKVEKQARLQSRGNQPDPTVDLESWAEAVDSLNLTEG
ncbi:putative pentatricopeptide repeat protein [Phaeomoniella chlamydospora]|uniref:Putative pentatricopeptide repeat protein n=1 Tax=Phaeomoniella chlamydospora TaxID=158046 RepID=A0A0G2EMH2_PHACM|nr:putative pentatricopeptide repeat protein [Phaeomoniella chlamydospora]